MVLKSKQEYIHSIRQLKSEAYMRGDRIEDVTKNPFTRLALEGIGAIYELSKQQNYNSLLTRTVEGAKVSAYCSIHRSREDLVNRVKAARFICQRFHLEHRHLQLFVVIGPQKSQLHAVRLRLHGI
ncbi:MAG: 4-hydroxyphenylacetate 3-hydroxylase N-terminal domain-containing protein [Candidatus Bathyarchaeia archaeon]